MKNIFYFLIFTILPITSMLFHLLTTYTAFVAGGLIAGVLTFFIPLLSEIFWLFKLWGNNLYTLIGVIHFIGAFFYTVLGSQRNN